MTRETPQPQIPPPVLPRLRVVEAQRVELDAQPMVALRDPAWPPDRVVLLSPAALALVSLFDGERDVAGLMAEFERRHGEGLDPDTVRLVVAQLDEALLLDSERYRADLESRRVAFRAQPLRSLTMGGDCFPAEAAEAQAVVDAFYQQPGGPGRLPEVGRGPPVEGIVAPHIDFDRGAALYAQAYLKLVEGAAEAELYVLLGTDHKGEVDTPYSLTALDYETPFGRLRTDAALVEQLSGAQPGLRAGELAHAREHSLEFQAVMLHHALSHREDVQVLPVLCGLLTDREGRRTPERDAAVESFIAVLRELRQARRVCFVAGADLAHVGPAFGTPPRTAADQQDLERADAETLRVLSGGDAEAFRSHVEADDNARNICGLSAIYTLLRVLEPASGTLLGYDQCPVPGESAGGSRVSITAFCYP